MLRFLLFSSLSHVKSVLPLLGPFERRPWLEECLTVHSPTISVFSCRGGGGDGGGGGKMSTTGHNVWCVRDKKLVISYTEDEKRFSNFLRGWRRYSTTMNFNSSVSLFLFFSGHIHPLQSVWLIILQKSKQKRIFYTMSISTFFDVVSTSSTCKHRTCFYPSVPCFFFSLCCYLLTDV